MTGRAFRKRYRKLTIRNLWQQWMKVRMEKQKLSSFPILLYVQTELIRYSLESEGDLNLKCTYKQNSKIWAENNVVNKCWKCILCNGYTYLFWKRFRWQGAFWNRQNTVDTEGWNHSRLLFILFIIKGTYLQRLFRKKWRQVSLLKSHNLRFACMQVVGGILLSEDAWLSIVYLPLVQ